MRRLSCCPIHTDDPARTLHLHDSLVGDTEQLHEAVHFRSGPQPARRPPARDRLGCLTRKTHAFAKEIALWDALFSLTRFEHNWLRPHLALRVPLSPPVNGRRYDRRTPAMAIGLTEHIWTRAEFLMLRGKAH